MGTKRMKGILNNLKWHTHLEEKKLIIFVDLEWTFGVVGFWDENLISKRRGRKLVVWVENRRSPILDSRPPTLTGQSRGDQRSRTKKW